MDSGYGGVTEHFPCIYDNIGLIPETIEKVFMLKVFIKAGFSTCGDFSHLRDFFMFLSHFCLLCLWFVLIYLGIIEAQILQSKIQNQQKNYMIKNVSVAELGKKATLELIFKIFLLDKSKVGKLDLVSKVTKYEFFWLFGVLSIVFSSLAYH